MMHTSIIPDAKYQQLNMSFTFDDQHQDRLVINAHIQNSIYQSEFTHHLSFLQVKSLLETKIFKLVEQSSKTLKLKVGQRVLDFSNGDKPIDNHIQQQINELVQKMLKIEEENNLLKKITLQLRKDLELITTKITNLAMKVNSNEQQNHLLKQSISKSSIQTTQIQKQLNSQKDIIKSQKQQITQLKNKINSQNTQFNCLKFQTKTQISDLLSQIQALKQTIKLPVKKDVLPPVNSDIQVFMTNLAYQFSQKYKSYLVSLSKNNTQAECDMFAGFALVDGIVNIKGSSIKFKIQKLSHGLDVGLAIKRIIVENSFDIKNAKKTGHGGFLLENDGASFSHSIEHYNNKGTGYEFFEGDVIEVMTNNTELIFRNKTKNWEYRMNVVLSDKQWSEACFCVYLSKGNAVKIVI